MEERKPLLSLNFEIEDCTIKRIMANKKSDNRWEYPDW
jgi:hypothetical protein